MDPALGLQNRIGEGLGLLLGQFQHMKGQPLGSFAADAGQPGKLVGKVLQGCGKILHGSSHSLRTARPDSALR